MNEILRSSAAHVLVADVSAPVLDDVDIHHLSRVLRLRDGETVTCTDGAGAWRACAWRAGILEPSGDVVQVAAPSPRVTVAFAPVKGDRTEDAVQRLVEVGVDRVVVLAPVERSVVRWDEARAAGQMERLRRVVRAATMQSRRVHLVTLEGLVAFDDVVGSPGVAIAEPRDAESAGADWDEVTTVVVGPEGGLAPGEVARARHRVALGPAILRAETAAVVAGALLVAHHRR